MNPEEQPTGGGVLGWIRNIPEFACLCLHCWPRNRWKGALYAAGKSTIDSLLYLRGVTSAECQIYIFHVENILISNQTIVVSHPAVRLIKQFIPFIKIRA